MGRALGLGQLGARFAAGQGRRLLSRDQSAAHAELARLLVEELGQMKGLPMKLGQIMSYMAGFVPEEHQEVYRRALARLRTTSPPVDRAVMEAVLVDDLGGSVDDLFEEFDWTPVASASIGQVYGARFEGREVCVKVQYPGITEATESDLSNVRAMAGLVRLLMPTVDAEQIIADFHRRLREECDYRQEARYQARFAEIYADDPALKVPEVVAERSGPRVLTTERIGGVPLEAFVGDADEAARAAAAEALFRFAFGSLLIHGLFHADPHPGNLLFRCDEAGRLGVLDFGCVQPADDSAQLGLHGLVRAAVDGEDLRAPAMQALGIEEIDPDSEAAVVHIASDLLTPLRAPQPFRFTPDFAASLGRYAVQAKADLTLDYLRRRGRISAPREGIMFIVRTLFGLASLWGEIGAQGDFRALAQQILAEAERARSAPEPV